jgi:glucokinase
MYETTDHEKQLVVALDLGGTEIKGALADRDGHLTALQARSSRRTGGTKAALDGLLDFAEELVACGRQAGRVVRLGLAVPGIVNEDRGVAVHSTRFGWRELSLGPLVSDRIGVPVSIGHDVRLAALGEQHHGAGRGCRDWLFVSVGTGIGAAVVLGGCAHGGGNWRAGELGHMVVEPGGRPCACGGAGCLETVSSGPAIAFRYAELGGDVDLPASEIARRARDSDPVACHVWGSAVAALAVGLSGAIALMDPERIVLGGGVAAAGDKLLEPLRVALAARLALAQPPPLHGAMLRKHAGCVGAAVLAWRVEEAAIRSPGACVV